MGISILDIAVVSLVGLSALFAFLRGFTREMLAIAAWIGAGFVVYRFFPVLRPWVATHISPPWIADFATGIGLFVGALIVFSILSHFLSERVRGSPVGPLDRTLGLLFGIARGALVACLLYGAAERFLVRENQPAWVKEARTAPLLQKGADYLVSLMPRERPGSPRPLPGQQPSAPQKAAKEEPKDPAVARAAASAIVSGLTGAVRDYRSVLHRSEDKR
jgi:membrane protein required for colicin V production